MGEGGVNLHFTPVFLLGEIFHNDGTHSDPRLGFYFGSIYLIVCVSQIEIDVCFVSDTLFAKSTQIQLSAEMERSSPLLFDGDITDEFVAETPR